METKVCSKCGEEKSLDSFYRQKTSKGGIRNRCKKCLSAECNKYREKNRIIIQEKKSIYYQLNRDKILEYQIAYRSENKQKIANRDKEYRDSNKEKKAENGKKYREENKERLREKGMKKYLSKKLDIPKEEIPDILVEAKIALIDANKKIKPLLGVNK